MAAMSPPSNLSLPRQKSPDKVRWPSQFVGQDGSLLIAGAFEEDEVPFGSGVCLACGTGDLGAPGPATPWASATPHILERAHLERRRCLREDYLCLWQELRAPDLRPYYYDHLSHTWSFAKPRSLQVPRCNPESEAGIGSANVTHFVKRLRQVLTGAPGQAVANEDADGGVADGWATGTWAAGGTSDPGSVPPGQGFAYTDSGMDQGWRCEFCNRIFSTDLAVQQHLTSMSGRKGHPVTQGPWYDCSWQRGDSVAGVAGGAGRTGVGGVQSPAMEAPDPVTPIQRYLSADGDVEEAERDGRRYFYNPWTGATDWTREGLVQLNLNFYAHLIIGHVGPGQRHGSRGQEIWWSWQESIGGVVHKAWTLTELYAKTRGAH